MLQITSSTRPECTLLSLPVPFCCCLYSSPIFSRTTKTRKRAKEKSSRRKKGAHAAAHKAAAVDAAPEEPTGESLTDEIRRKTDNLLTDDEVEAIRQTVESGRFDKAAADALRQELIKREAERDAQ